jgi:hypothetical protein
MAYYEGTINDLGCNNNGGMFGNNGDWIWAFLLFALLGNGGWGGVGYGGGRGGVGENYVLATDFATIERKLDGVNNGLCDGFYAQNTNMLNGFASVQQTLCQGFNGLNTAVMQGFHGVDNAVCTLGYNTQAGFNALSTQLAQCCCDTRSAIADLKYANEKQTCDVINASNANTRAILDYLTGEKIASLTAENAGLKAQISNDRQSAYIIGALTPKCPEPAYIVPNPNCCYGTCGASVQ